jgi:type III pantothenate kinase
LHQIGVEPGQIDACVIASVVPSLTGECAKMSRRYLKTEPLVIGPDTRTEMRIHYDPPSRLGVDRLADVVAARELYGKPVIVIDFGTATTFNVVDQNGDFQGGAITFGLNTAAKLLQDFELVFPPKVIATDTIKALQSGTLYGYLGLVEGMVRRLKDEQGYEATVVATGGLADIIAEHTDAIDVVNPNLTLEGLQLIWELNCRQTPVSR